MKRNPISLALLVISIYLFACNDTGTNPDQNLGILRDSAATSAPSADVTEPVRDTAATADGHKYGDMKQYWLVFLKSGFNRNQDSISEARIQEAHLRNIERLNHEGIIVMAGPMGYATPHDLKGIFIMDAKDSVTAAGYIKTDSAIISGRLRFEIHPWWAAKGTYIFK